MRAQFTQALRDLRDDILMMGSLVQEQHSLTLHALENLDVKAAAEVIAMDRQINEQRFEIEEKCLVLVSTQQPTARDVRLIFAATNMIVDLERMGDQCKGVARVIPTLLKHPGLSRPAELQRMGREVGQMLQDVLRAYAHDDVELANKTCEVDDQIDALYANVFTQVLYTMARLENTDEIEAVYHQLRAAREFERFGDLVTNVAERSIYLVTGSMRELNPEETGPE